MNMHKSRTCVFLLLYQKEFYPEERYEEQQDIFLNEVKKEDPLSEEETAYIEQMIDKISLHLPEIDKYISEASERWKLSRIAKAELAILRLGTYEVMYDDTVPDEVAINEAIELAKDYGKSGAYKYVNGVLDAIRKSHKAAVKQES